MAIYQLGERTPRIPESAYVANEATVIGDVVLGERASLWPGVVARGDNESIRVGVGHQAMLHGCTIGDGSLIGIQSVILNNAVIGRQCIVGAGSVIPEGKQFPDRSLILGAPARVVRRLTDENLAMLRFIADSYAQRQEIFKTQLKRIG
jgi:carbonic anhydrase/acetyltransferase-like protein (isoleucine patch superfamily)